MIMPQMKEPAQQSETPRSEVDRILGRIRARARARPEARTRARRSFQGGALPLPSHQHTVPEGQTRGRPSGGTTTVWPGEGLTTTVRSSPPPQAVSMSGVMRTTSNSLRMVRLRGWLSFA